MCFAVGQGEPRHAVEDRSDLGRSHLYQCRRRSTESDFLKAQNCWGCWSISGKNHTLQASPDVSQDSWTVRKRWELGRVGLLHLKSGA